MDLLIIMLKWMVIMMMIVVVFLVSLVKCWEYLFDVGVDMMNHTWGKGVRVANWNENADWKSRVNGGNRNADNQEAYNNESDYIMTYSIDIDILLTLSEFSEEEGENRKPRYKKWRICARHL